MSVIAYHPPKSVSHGHGPRTRGSRKTWTSIQKFLDEQTLTKLPPSFSLTTRGADQWTDSDVVEIVRSGATDLFGLPTKISGEYFIWELPLSCLDEALEFVFADGLRPKQGLDPVDLYVSYNFIWKTMPNPKVLSEYFFRRGNQLGISVSGRRVYIQPVFLFQASDQNHEFIAHLKQLETAMPFKPKDTYYYRIEQKKSGKGEKLVKLHSGWKDVV